MFTFHCLVSKLMVERSRCKVCFPHFCRIFVSDKAPIHNCPIDNRPSRERRVHSVRPRVSVVASIVVVDGDKAAVAKVLGPALAAAADLADVLVGVPHVITRDLAVLAAVVGAADGDLAAELLVVGPTVALERERRLVRRVDLAAALHAVHGLVAPFNVGGAAQRLSLAVVVGRRGRLDGRAGARWLGLCGGRLVGGRDAVAGVDGYGSTTPRGVDGGGQTVGGNGVGVSADHDRSARSSDSVPALYGRMRRGGDCRWIAI